MLFLCTGVSLAAIWLISFLQVLLVLFGIVRVIYKTNYTKVVVISQQLSFWTSYTSLNMLAVLIPPLFPLPNKICTLQANYRKKWDKGSVNKSESIFLYISLALLQSADLILCTIWIRWITVFLSNTLFGHYLLLWRIHPPLMVSTLSWLLIVYS